MLGENVRCRQNKCSKHKYLLACSCQVVKVEHTIVSLLALVWWSWPGLTRVPHYPVSSGGGPFSKADLIFSSNNVPTQKSIIQMSPQQQQVFRVQLLTSSQLHFINNGWICLKHAFGQRNYSKLTELQPLISNWKISLHQNHQWYVSYFLIIFYLEIVLMLMCYLWFGPGVCDDPHSVHVIFCLNNTGSLYV